MKDLPIGQLLAQANHLASTNQLCTENAGKNFRIPTSDALELLETIRSFAKNCEDFSLTASSIIASRLANELEKIIKPATELTSFAVIESLTFRSKLDALMQCIDAETSVTRAHSLTTEQYKLYSPDTPHWPDVRASLPGVSFDIDESAKCLALGRHTAAVFHCMRILEACISKIKLDLGLNKSSNPNWGTSLQELREHIHKQGASWNHRNHYQKLLHHFQCIKDALRNATMHMENVYVLEEAQLIFANSHALAKLAVTQP